MKKKVLTIIGLLLSLTITGCSFDNNPTPVDPTPEPEPEPEPITLVDIALDTENVKTTFEYNEEFTYENLRVIAIYSDTSKQEVFDYEVSDPDMSTEGEKAINVTYENKVTSYTINVLPEPLPQVVKVKISDSNDEYAKGDIFSECHELTFTAIYDNGDEVEVSQEEVEITVKRDYDISGVSRTQDITQPFKYSGGYTVYATYQEVEADFLQFKVLNYHSWLVSLSIDGPESGKMGETITLNTSSMPTESSAAINYFVDDQEVAGIASANKNNVEVELYNEGTVTITAESKNKYGETISATHQITVEAISLELTEMKQTYQDYGYNRVYYSNYRYSYCPSKGQPKVIVIPVWFTDSSNIIDENHKDNVKDDIRKAYLGTEEETGWHSVKTYYYQESAGKCDIQGVATDWYECGFSIRQAGQGYTQNILDGAVSWYFEHHQDESRTDFDTDGDGYLDAIMLIYAAPDNSQYGYNGYGNLWAYTSWTMAGANKNNPTANVFFWSSYDFMYGGNALERSGVNYSRGDTRVCKVDAHCLIHEMGHVLGLDDYYDYGGSVQAAGGFSMQDYNVGGHDAFSVMAYGWASAYIPTETTTIKLKSFQEHKEAILLTPKWNEYDSPFDEYLLLELYTPTGLNELDASMVYLGGYPAGSTDVGIRLWHVDARLVKNNASTFNLTFYNDVYAGEKADKRFYIETAFNNTSEGSRASRFGAEYNLLQLIRNDENEVPLSQSSFKSADLFKAGDTYTMETYKSQFVKGAYLNSGAKLGWSFKVNSIQKGLETYASITVTKL